MKLIFLGELLEIKLSIKITLNNNASEAAPEEIKIKLIEETLISLGTQIHQLKL